MNFRHLGLFGFFDWCIETEKNCLVLCHNFHWYSRMLKSEHVWISDRGSLFSIKHLKRLKFKLIVLISGTNLCLKSKRYGLNVQILALLAFLCYECQNPNDLINQTIRNPNKSVQTSDCSDCLDFSIPLYSTVLSKVWILMLHSQHPKLDICRFNFVRWP